MSEEAWRYSDMEALARLWPLPAPESIIVPAGGEFARAIVQDEGGIQQIDMSIGKGAKPRCISSTSEAPMDVLS